MEDTAMNLEKKEPEELIPTGMTKEDLEKLVGGSIADRDYTVIETVRKWYPRLRSMSYEESALKVATLYREFGIGIFDDMQETAVKIRMLEIARENTRAKAGGLASRIRRLLSGDKSLERCIDAVRYVITKYKDDPKAYAEGIDHLRGKFGDETVRTAQTCILSGAADSLEE